MRNTVKTNTALNIIDDSNLDQVCGGNTGDYAKDINESPRYFVGQHVELITGHFLWHALTEGRTVTDVRKVNGHWKYELEKTIGDSWSEWEWHTADEIES